MDGKIRGIKRHKAIQKKIRRTRKSNIKSLDNIIENITNKEAYRSFSEIPFRSSRTDIVILVPRSKLIFIEFKTTSIDKYPETTYIKQIRKNLNNFKSYIKNAPKKYHLSYVSQIKFYYLLAVEKCVTGECDTKIIFDGLSLPNMRYERMFTELSAHFKSWVKKKIIKNYIKKKNDVVLKK